MACCNVYCSTGTDRTNIVEIPNANSSYPKPFEQDGATDGMFTAELLWTPGTTDKPMNPKDLVAYFASAGYYRCYAGCSATESVLEKEQMNQLLNNAPASFEGAVLRYTRSGVYHYMCSRNNNFTNRSQKGQLTVQ